MVSIHERPVEVQGRQVPGHWEGDLLKGAGNASAVGTLVERKSRFVLLAKVDGVDAQSVLEGFTRRMRTLPSAVRLTLAYDQGEDMARHRELAQRLNIRVYFADPHCPWQRPTDEHTNGLLRQYLPKGMDFLGVIPALPRQHRHRARHPSEKMPRLSHAARGHYLRNQRIERNRRASNLKPPSD